MIHGISVSRTVLTINAVSICELVMIVGLNTMRNNEKAGLPIVFGVFC